MTHFVIGRAGEPGLGAPLLDSMYRLRCAVFHERLHWNVHVEHGREHDWFDLIGPHYIVAHESASTALGCCRLLPTTGPNMLRDIFPFLLADGRAPSSPATWEVSRFAIDPRGAAEGFGFGAIAAGMLAEMFRFSGARQVDTLVGEIAQASLKQTDGIVQVNAAVTQIDKVTQSNAAGAEESAAAAEQLNAQALVLKENVAELIALVDPRAQVKHQEEPLVAPKMPVSAAAAAGSAEPRAPRAGAQAPLKPTRHRGQEDLRLDGDGPGPQDGGHANGADDHFER